MAEEKELVADVSEAMVEPVDEGMGYAEVIVRNVMSAKELVADVSEAKPADEGMGDAEVIVRDVMSANELVADVSEAKFEPVDEEMGDAEVSVRVGNTDQVYSLDQESVEVMVREVRGEQVELLMSGGYGDVEARAVRSVGALVADVREGAESVVVRLGNADQVDNLDQESVEEMASVVRAEAVDGLMSGEDREARARAVMSTGDPVADVS